MSSRIEPNDGRIITKVRIKAPSLIPNQKGLDRTIELVADTGGITIMGASICWGREGQVT